jgi:hypothetical protein
MVLKIKDDQGGVSQDVDLIVAAALHDGRIQHVLD